jgi:hypothetical protein
MKCPSCLTEIDDSDVASYLQRVRAANRIARGHGMTTAQARAAQVASVKSRKRNQRAKSG